MCRDINTNKLSTYREKAKMCFPFTIGHKHGKYNKNKDSVNNQDDILGLMGTLGSGSLG